MDMQKVKSSYLKKLIIFLFLLFSIDFTAGRIISYLYKNSNSGLCYQENYIMNKTNQDIIIYGASRASYHYMPSIIENSLKMSCYNAGREGSGIYYHYGVLLNTVKRYIPKIIILEIDLADIYDGGIGFSKEILKEHYPFYNLVSEEFDSLIITQKYQKILIESNLYKYNTKFFQILKGNIYSKKDSDKGFKSLTDTFNHSIKLYSGELKMDLDKIHCIEKFIKKARESGSQVVLVVSPIFSKMPTSSFSPLIALSAKYKTIFLNYSDDSTFLSNRGFFSDEFHLNVEGARYFSSKIATELKTLNNNVN